MNIKLTVEINGVQYDLSEDTEFKLTKNKKGSNIEINHNGYTIIYDISDKNKVKTSFEN